MYICLARVCACVNGCVFVGHTYMDNSTIFLLQSRRKHFCSAIFDNFLTQVHNCSIFFLIQRKHFRGQINIRIVSKLLFCIIHSSIKILVRNVLSIFNFLTFFHYWSISAKKIYLTCINHTFLERQRSNRPK